MKKFPSENYFFFALCLFAGIVNCYDVSLSQRYLKMEINKWSNFTMHIETRDYVYVNSVTVEVNHTSIIRVSPKIVEVHTKNFSSWCHMFHVYAMKPGISKILFNFGNSSSGDDVKNLHIDVDVVKMKVLEPYTDWCRKYYYIFSIISVYPQIFLQFLRLSVVGLDMDYVCFNFIGYLSYAVYTVFMYSQTDYIENNPLESFPVTLTENMYSLHGLIISTLLGLQAIKYHGIDKRVTVIGKELISFYGIIFTFGFLLAKFHIIQYIEFLCICRYIYIATMSTKYIPQIYKNFVIKSTLGWNIWNSNLELIGCLALITSTLLVSYNYDDWKSLLLSESLFWMACAISLQHVVFIIQHYLIYRRQPEFDLSELQEITLHEKMSLYEQRIYHC